MLVTYQTNCGQYVLHRDGAPVGPLLDEVAVAYTLDSVDCLLILHKHGSVHSVNAWLQTTKAKLSTSGTIGRQMASDICVISGRFPLDDLNGAIAGSQGCLQKLVLESRTIEVIAREVEPHIFALMPNIRQTHLHRSKPI